MWGQVTAAVVVPTGPTLPPVVATHNIIHDDIYFAQNRAEDIARVRNEGFEVDDDNDPAPENIPDPAEGPPVVIEAGLYEGQTWGWDGIDCRHTVGGRYDEPFNKVGPQSGRLTSSSSYTSSRWRGFLKCSCPGRAWGSSILEVRR